VQGRRGIASLHVSFQPVDDSTMHVHRPLRQAEFSTDKQLKFMLALASSAGTTAENVEILSIDDSITREVFNCATGAPFGMLEKDGDGLISKKEWEERFDYFDTNKDNYITAKEFSVVTEMGAKDANGRRQGQGIKVESKVSISVSPT